MYATAEIVLQQHDNVLTLPLTAVINADKQALCCCVEDGKIVRKPITLGLKTAQDVEVADGLKGDEVVVQTQVGSLQDEQRVERGAAGNLMRRRNTCQRDVRRVSERDEEAELGLVVLNCGRDDVLAGPGQQIQAIDDFDR